MIAESLIVRLKAAYQSFLDDSTQEQVLVSDIERIDAIRTLNEVGSAEWLKYRDYVERCLAKHISTALAAIGEESLEQTIVEMRQARVFYQQIMTLEYPDVDIDKKLAALRIILNADDAKSAVKPE